MAGNYFEIDTGILGQNTDELRQQLENLKAKFKEMTEDMAALDAMWDGPASEAFKAQFIKDCEVSDEYCEAMREYIECLEFAAKEYNNCESKVRAAIDAIRIG